MLTNKSFCISLLLLLTFISCRRGETRPAYAAGERDTIRVAVMPTTACLPFFAASASHVFDSLGIDVLLRNYQAQMDIDTAIARGHVDVAYSDLIRIMLLQEAGTKVYVAGEADAGLTLATARKGRVRNLHQLKERMVAMARNSITDYWCDRMADSAGLSRTDFFRPQINSLKIRTDMLLAGTMDAAFLPEPQATMVALLRQKHNFTTQGLAPRLGVWAVTDTTRREVLRHLWDGYMTAERRIASGESDVLLPALLREHYAVPDSLADTVADIIRRKATIQEQVPARPADEAIQAALRWLSSRNLKATGYEADTLLISN